VASKEKSFAVVGLSRFGFQVATGLFSAGADVLTIDRDDNIIQKIADRVTRAVRTDALDEEVLEHLGVFEVDTVVIGFRNSFDAAILLSIMLRKNNEGIEIIAQVDTDEKAEALHQVGVDVTVFPERDIADRLVKRLMTPDLVEHMELAPDVAVIEMEVPKGFIGKSLVELDVRAQHEVHVIGIIEPGDRVSDRKVIFAPPANTVFRQGEIVLLLGKIANLKRFTELNHR
jgi:trk system potassium uptake protein TrkA